MNNRVFQLFQYALSCVVILSLLLGAATSSFAQSDAKAEVRSKEVIDIVAKGMAEANDKKKVASYLDSFFELWTDEENKVNLPYYRANMLETLKKISNQTSSAYRVFVDMVYAKTLELTKSDNFVVQYNAVLFLGELNEAQEPGKPAVPHAAAREELLKILKAPIQASEEAPKEGEKAKNQNVLANQQALKIAALRGLVRQTDRKAQLPADAKKKLAEAFDVYAFSAENAENADSKAEKTDGKTENAEVSEDSDVAVWMRDLAIQGLGNIGDPGAKGVRITKLYNIVTKSQRYNIETRMLAGFAISQMNMEVTLFTAAKPMEVITAIAKMAAEALKYECIDRRYSLAKSTGDVKISTKKDSEKAAEIVPITMEEQTIQIRFLRQRVKFIASAFSIALSRSDKNPWERLLDNNDKEKYAKIAKAFRTINEMCDYDAFEKTKKERGGDADAPKAKDSELTYELAQERILKELKVLYGVLGMDASTLKVPKVKEKELD